MLQSRQVPWLEAEALDDLYLDLNDGVVREEVVADLGIATEAEKGDAFGGSSQREARPSFESNESLPIPPLRKRKAQGHPRSSALPVATSFLSRMRRIPETLFGDRGLATVGSSAGEPQVLHPQFMPERASDSSGSQANYFPRLVGSATAFTPHGLDIPAAPGAAAAFPPPRLPPAGSRSEGDQSDADGDERRARQAVDGFSSSMMNQSRDSRSESSSARREKKEDGVARHSAQKEAKEEEKKKVKKLDCKDDRPAVSSASSSAATAPPAASLQCFGLGRLSNAAPRPVAARPACVLAEERMHGLARRRLSIPSSDKARSSRRAREISEDGLEEEARGREETALEDQDAQDSLEEAEDEEVVVKTPSVASCASERDEEVEKDVLRPLRCHVLFSSPLCVERPVALVLPIPPLPETNLEAFFKSQYATWGFSFEALEPTRLSRVFGLAKEQNRLQSHAEAMLRPGDEVYKVVVLPESVEATTRPASSTAASTAATSSPTRSAQPPRVPLQGGLQALVQNQPLAAVLARLLASQPRSSGSLKMQLIFRGMRPLPQLDVEEEVAEVRRSGCVAVPGALTSENFRRLIAARDCEVLHLALHCSSGQAQHLYLEDMQGKAHVMSSKDFEGLLRAGQDLQCIKLVVLNACHSLTVGQCFVAAGVQHVVCVHDDREVRDESCRSFTQNFFSALRYGRSVQEAFDCGVACLQHAASSIHQRDASAFLLLPEGDHSAVLTSSTSRSAASAPVLPSRLPPVVEDFMGREVDLWKTMCLLKSRRLVSLSGVKGIGKTALLAALGHFIHLRRQGGCAFDQVYWLGGKTASEDFKLLMEFLATTPDLNVLVIVNKSSMETCEMPVQGLLSFSRKVRLVVEASNAWTAGGDVKSTPLALGPLEPLSQARLFLQRAARPLYDFELEPSYQPGQMPSCEPNLANISPQPRDLMEFAELPWFKELQGVPLRIVEVAQSLKKWEAAASGPMGPASLVKVRAVRPDGRSKDLLLRETTTLQEVLDKYSPSGLQPSEVELCVDDCQAPMDAKLSDFFNDKARLAGFITLRFREVSDW